MMHSPRLPTELCDIVIDNLSHDGAALRACSLTCKAFLPASRYHLFYTVRLKGRKVKGFLEFIDSSPKIGLYVRRLLLFEGRGRYSFEPRWLSSALPTIVNRFPEVLVLTLDSLDWRLLDSDARTAVISGFQKVKSLETIFTHFEDPGQMNQFISSFPSLIDLSCSQTYWAADHTPRFSSTPLPLSLTAITLDSFQAEFFDQLMNLESHPDVRHVQLYSMDHANTAGKLLKTLGSSLEHVSLRDFHYALGPMYTNADCKHSLIDIDSSFTCEI
jgi:hypothetical protein